MDYKKRAREVISIEIEELKNLKQNLDQNFDLAIESLAKCINESGKIIVSGIGKSGNICKKIGATFTSTGAPAIFLDSVNAMHGDLGIISKNDIAILISYSGESEELIKLIPHLKRFVKKIIAISGNKNSRLAQNSDIFLNCHVKREACPHNLAPTSSSTVALVLGDALAMSLLEARGFSKNDFAKYHPSGSLGKKLLTKVKDIMRQGNQVAIANEKSTISTVLENMSKAHSGACAIINTKKELSGIFTQGDFVRLFQKQIPLENKEISDFMTKNPITVKENELAIAVIDTLSKNQIDDLIVISKDKKPVGIVDSQDLSRLRLI